MFKYELRQKILSDQKGEDLSTNLIATLYKCIQMAHKTESPIDNLTSIGLKFYSAFFLIDYKLLSSILMIPTTVIKNQLLANACAIYLPGDFPRKEKIAENWAMHRYGNTIDCQNIVKMIHNNQLYYYDSKPPEKNEEERRMASHMKSSESDFSISVFPSKIQNYHKTSKSNSNKCCRPFITNDFIFFTGPISKPLSTVELQVDDPWPFTKRAKQ